MQMKLIKPDFSTFTAALILGSVSMGFAPAATAASTYNAFAEFTLTLDRVSGSGAGGGWTIDVFSDDLGGPTLTEEGSATATGETILAGPSIGIGESIYQSSSSSGIAYNGTASTDAFTELAVTISNNSNSPQVFHFDWSYGMSAATTTESTIGEANAYASIDLLDSVLGDGPTWVDIVSELDETSGPGVVESMFSEASDSGMLNISVAGGETFMFDGFVDTGGYASAVPVPAAVWLFGSGLLGLVAMARRRTKAA